MPWDLDMMFLAETHWPGVIDQNNALSRPNLSIEFRNRCREILDLMCSDESEDGGQIGQLIDEYADIVNPQNLPLTWADVDEAMWNWHPQARGNNQPSGQTDHKGNFYRTPFTDSRIGGSWVRTLATSNHEGFVKYLLDYTTDSDPNSFAPGDGDQRGYGFNFLELEATDGAIPEQPTITYSGETNFPVNGLRFRNSSFADAQGANTFGAMQWRLAEIYNPGLSNYVAGEPRKYEIEASWESGELTTFANEIAIPVTIARAGATYRARVRLKDNTGRWSHWSRPVQFVAGAPDVSTYSNAVMITEVMYAPTGPTAAEAEAGFVTSDFEFFELSNITDAPVDLTGLRFTKGVDFDFPEGATLPAQSYGIVARNTNAFAARYGTNILTFGAFGPDQLANEGEQVKLSYGAGLGIHDFIYLTVAPWPTNLAGRSIVLLRPETRPLHSEGTNWVASSQVGGTPGTGEMLTGQTFAAWKSAHGIINDNDDSDGDGLMAFLEYATGSDPRAPSAERLPTLRYDESAHKVRAVVYQSPTATEARFEVQSSIDLAAWIVAEAESISKNQVQGAERCEHVLAIDDRVAQEFFRIVVRRN